jgi:hypothetical protein
MPLTSKITDYGFEYGAAKVERSMSDKKTGWVCITVKTKKDIIDLYVTKTGKVTVLRGEKVLD